MSPLAARRARRPSLSIACASAAVAFAAMAAVLGAPARAGEPHPPASLFASSLKATPSERLSHAWSQFATWEHWIEILVGVALSVGLASLLAYHPRTAGRRDLAEAGEERKTLVILGVIGAVVSGLVAVDQSMAFVVFGIGSLIRFRTVIGNPHMTGRAILVVVVGLACGLGQYLSAILVSGAAWMVIYWLHARRATRFKLRVGDESQRGHAEIAAAECLRGMKCRVQSLAEGSSGRSFTLVALVPAALDDELVAKSVAAGLAGEFGRVEVEVRA